jgi:epoxyqueuosine reductase
MSLAATIKQRALEIGFDLVGIAPASAEKDLAFLPQWIAKGYAGEMRYLANPRRTDPRKVLPAVKSIICVGLVYNTRHPYSTEIEDAATGATPSASEGAECGDPCSRAWISRYAWGRDYHDVMRSRLEALRGSLNSLVPGVETRVDVDTGPIVERAFARRSGIGWMGKNTCIINEGKGSWFFLGVILTSLALDIDAPAADRCGSCTRCLEACPTGALVAPYVMDASRCISYLTIELKGAIPESLRAAMGRNVFGCDICQDVCPWNQPLFTGSRAIADGAGNLSPGAPSGRRHVATTGAAEFQPMRIEMRDWVPGQQPAAHGQRSDFQISRAERSVPALGFSLFHPSLEDLAALAEEDFRRLLAPSPLQRAKYRGWLRNVCVAMGNSGNCAFVPWLESAAQHPDAVVRDHAAWALRRLRG